MAQVLIRDVAPEIIDKLKEQAHRNHRSLEAELRLIVEAAADRANLSRSTEVDRVRALFHGRAFDDSAVLLRADRDR